MKCFVSLKVEGLEGPAETTTFELPPFPEGKRLECATIVLDALKGAAEVIGGIAGDLTLVSVTRHLPEGDETLDAETAKKRAEDHLRGGLVRWTAGGAPPEAFGLPPRGKVLDS
jgi:hypothetical protein